MTFKVVKGPNGEVLGYGPNIDEYSPSIPFGGSVEVADSAPDFPKQKAMSITPRQIRQALNSAGLRGRVENFIAAGSQDLKDWWEFSSLFERNHPALISAANSIGLDPEQVDELFSQASSL